MCYDDAMNIVLHQPEIPDNTGNIGRTCMATGSRLHLIEPIGFQLSDRALKRAGMDYWQDVDCTRYVNFADFLEKCAPKRLWMLSTKAGRAYTEVSFLPEDYLMFGREGGGIPEELLRADPEHCLRIPMKADARSLNLANSVAIVLFEALRQNGFPGLSQAGAFGS